MNDPYEVLGVARTASQDEIKKRYRELAKKLHPDLHPGDDSALARFQDVSAAYDLLSDADKRGRFDRGEIDAAGQERAPERPFYRAHGEGRGGAKYGGGGFDGEDLFADLFGGSFGRGSGKIRMRGHDVHGALGVPFLDAVRGTTRRVTIEGGPTLEVRIPPGTEDGQTLRLKEQGGPGLNGGPPGDAYIEIHVEPHPLFRRVGADIELDLPISLPEAVLGARVTVPTIDGPVLLTVPKGSNTGDVLRLKNRGVPDARTGARGDQKVRLVVKLPEQVDPALEKAVEAWAKDHAYDVRGDPAFKS